MRTFEIVSVLGRRKRPVGWLRYCEESGQATIRIADDAQIGHVPAMFNRFIELGNRLVDEEWTYQWVSERIPPESRHNIDEILEYAGLSDYDPYALLFVSEGRSAQDDFFLREVFNEPAEDGGAAGEASAGRAAAEGGRYEYALASLQHSIGQRVAQARVEAGMTQQDLAYRTGIRQSTISRLERGKTNPTVETLVCIATALGLQLSVTLK